MDAARQLRAATLKGIAWIGGALSAAFRGLSRRIRLVAAGAPRIVALEHKLDPTLATLMVGIGIPLSFLTLPLWWYALQGM